ncbi:hypothetical protein [Pseudomonas fulva]|uniref:hypothetical protein n=1 Tax=Pseudomonas fulva TaxID=47880 RepID=UPI0038169855
MKVARHPHTQQPVTIPDYRKEFGAPYEKGIKNERPAATCPACKQELFIKGETNPNATMAFCHFPAKGGEQKPFCPIKVGGSHKYKVLCPVDEDPKRTKQLRDNFFTNWKIHWVKFMHHVGYVDINDFIQALKVADKEHVWRYRQLQEHEVIIVLMLISDFKPVIGKTKVLRKNWIRFWFEFQVKTFQKFWNLSDEKKTIIRAEYNVPTGLKRISPDHLCKYKDINVSEDYLLNRQPGDDVVHPVVANAMKRNFKV